MVMIIKIETMPVCKMAYLRQTGPYGEINKQTMESLKAWTKNNHLLNDESVILGIAQDNPRVTAPESCRYDACLIVPDEFSLSDDALSYGTLVGGKYAVFTIEHTPQAMQKAWNNIFTELHTQGCSVDTSKPIIERYAIKMVSNHKCEICVPLH